MSREITSRGRGAEETVEEDTLHVEAQIFRDSRSL
jgi:hypothetical protein